MLLPRFLLAICLAMGAPAFAQSSETPAAPLSPQPSQSTLAQALQLDGLFAVLREEGLAYGTTLEADMFPGGGGPDWSRSVAAIYDTAQLRGRFDTALETALGDDTETRARIVDFFTSDLGQRVVRLEIEARNAFLDEATEEAARVAADKGFSKRDPKQALLRRFIEAGDLVEMNVAGSLSGSFAFMTALSDAGVYGGLRPEDEIMSDVWAQEEQIREDTTSWLYAYLGLAYSPLTEAELEAYAEFMESPAGQRLNAALFTAFDEVFRQVSYDLGRAAGLAMLGRDI